MRSTVVMSTGASNMRLLVGNAVPDISDPITLDPDLVGSKGRAWKCNLAEGHRLKGVRPEDDAGLVSWMIEAPWAHPLWHSYSLVMVHLRSMPDGRETHFYLPCASHEMWLAALDPTRERAQLVATGIVNGLWLSPLNFGAQFTELSDADALARIERAVREICDGTLSPDTDARSEWVKRFGDNMVKREYR